MIKVSVVVPVYNVEEYLPACLDSLVKQTIDSYEVIVVNDGTKDNSQAIIDDYVLRYPDIIKSFIKENGGLSDARNYGLKHVSGEYTAFIDSDDFIDDDYLLKLYESGKKYNSDIVMADMCYLREDGSTEMGTGADFEVSSFKENHKVVFINHSANNKLFKTEFLKDKEFIKGIWFEDLATIPVWLGKADKLTYVKGVNYNYLQRSGSITHSANPKIFDIYFSVNNIVTKLNLNEAEASYFYFKNCLTMTTLQIKNIADKNTRLEYYKENIRRLNEAFPKWYSYARKYEKNLKWNVVYFMFKHNLINLLDKIY